MHLHDSPKERVPKAPKTWKELLLQFNHFLQLLFNKFLKAVSVHFACVT
jgi:hypothetical protein